MTKTSWIIFITVVVLGLGSLIVWTRITNPPLDVSGIDSAVAISASEKNGNIGDHVTGNKESKAVLVEFGDYQCPGCGSAAPNVERFIAEHGDRVGFIFRNLPITSIHPNAKVAAAAAEAAGLQGKFWEMNSHIYKAQGEWSNANTKERTDIFRGYAEALKLDVDKFVADMASAEVAAKIKFDQAIAARDNVTATPTFVLNGKKLSDEATNGLTSGNFDLILKEIDAILK